MLCLNLTHDKSYDKLFLPPQENGKQYIEKGIKVLTTNFTVVIESPRADGLITYSLDQQSFEFKYWTQKVPPKTSNPDKLTNLELWGVNFDSKSYEKKWTIHGIIENMGFYPSTENPCVMMRENLKTKCCEYIAVYQHDLYIA